MEHTPEHDVTATRPDSPVHTAGTDHMTVMGGDAASTIAFYRDLLGMPLVLEQPNLDAPELTHLFFGTGDGRILTFFVGEDRPTRPHRGPGNVHHLAFTIAPGEFDDTKAALNEAGAGFVDDGHMQAALEELGLDPTPTSEGDAPTGTGV